MFDRRYRRKVRRYLGDHRGGRHRLLPAMAIVVFATVACVADAPQPSVDARATTEPTLSPTVRPTQTPPPLQRDLAARPQIWFAPLDPSPPDASRPFSGRLDFMRLFEPDARWKGAAGGIHVFKLYGGWVAGTATPDELETVVADLNRRGIAIGFEASPLTQTEECGTGVEGFSGVSEGLRIVEKLKAAGAEVRFVAFDHPYDAGVLDDGPTACHWSPDKTAANVADYVEAIRGVYPDIAVGDIETAALDVAEVARWVDAYRRAVGEDLAFFHLDHDFRRPRWQDAMLAIESLLRDRGIDFGAIYIGDADDPSDAQWLAHAEERMVAYEIGAGGRPDHVILQSWHSHPERLLPETDAAAFTHLITRYLRTRTSLEIQVETGGDGATVRGVLTTADGAPVPAATVEFAMEPMVGAGLEYDYTVSGTVPGGAIQADVGYRVNLECDCIGPADFVLHEVHYGEGDRRNRVPNGDFSRGLDGWASWGDAAQELKIGGLWVAAGAGQQAAINSAPFPVTARASYTVTFVARVHSASAGSGYFSLIFSDGVSEVSREMVPLLAPRLPLAESVTDVDGRYELQQQTLPPGVALVVSFAGTAELWPAEAKLLP